MDNETKKTIIFAGEILKEGFFKIQKFREKERFHLQSDYDLQVDSFLKNYLLKKFPTYSIYSEETEQITKNGNEKWIIDPIDGTSYFIFGEPFFAISLAKEINGLVVEAHVYNPISHEYYYSDSVSNTSTLNGKAIQVSRINKIDDSLFAFGFSANPKGIEPYLSNFRFEMENCRKALPWIAPALSICNVARGRIEAFIDYGCSYEGQAAASLILKNAGGSCTNIDNSQYDQKIKGGIFTNGKVNIDKRGG